jgi:hypothetical protein
MIGNEKNSAFHLIKRIIMGENSEFTFRKQRIHALMFSLDYTS